MHVTLLTSSPPPERVARALAPRGGLAWLDGGLEHGSEGRWSFVAAGPSEVKRVPFGIPDPLATLDALGPDREDPGAGHGGPLAPGQVPRWIGYLAYDAHWSGRPGARHGREEGALALWLARYETLYAYDHAREEGFVVGDRPAEVQALAAALESLGDASGGVDTAFEVGPLDVPPEAAHREAVGRAVRHMRDGDIYQVNLARRFRGTFGGSALGLWMAMRRESPVPLGAFVDAGDHAVLACTMERFLRFDRSTGALTTRPIKGTLARQGDDGGERTRLRSDPKEVAEHSMVVDLMRNDLGRVARPGSVRVEPLMEVEAFRGLHHLVSTVHAVALDGLSLGELMEATFPPGSVTGTPKLRAMEIIEALEPCPRGIYCGAVGFVDRAGGCSWAVAIRTATVARGHVEYFAGGGLVVESDPERETRETVLKAGVFLRATGHTI